mmetsp:Transcript_1075/g.2245  ORF Transcript_1075/g.2245 Transcript_1075/m.2245 type:complete len:114 (+) Transcript_1075:2277-2618(+)
MAWMDGWRMHASGRMNVEGLKEKKKEGRKERATPWVEVERGEDTERLHDSRVTVRGEKAPLCIPVCLFQSERKNWREDSLPEKVRNGGREKVLLSSRSLRACGENSFRQNVVA